MFARVFTFVTFLLLVGGLCFGQAPQATKAPTSSYGVDHQAQLQKLFNSTQAQIQALEMQIASASPRARDSLEVRVAEVKTQSEIRRLEILPQVAREKSDDAKIAELERAIDYWRNPPQPRPVLITKDPNAKLEDPTLNKPAGK